MRLPRLLKNAHGLNKNCKIVNVKTKTGHCHVRDDDRDLACSEIAKKGRTENRHKTINNNNNNNQNGSKTKR